MLTKEEAFFSGLCMSCNAYLVHGRVKCGALPLEGKMCPRGKTGEVEIVHIDTAKSGAQPRGSLVRKGPKVEGKQRELF